MFEFSCGRSSPLVEPTKAAKSASETRDRTQQLAQPKKVHNSYEANREVRLSSGIDLWDDKIWNGGQIVDLVDAWIKGVEFTTYTNSEIFDDIELIN